MTRPDLEGRRILVVEDEPLIVMDIKLAFEVTGAEILTAYTLEEAMSLVERDGISAAIVDHQLRDGRSDELCERLKELELPFVLYTGHRIDSGPCSGEPQVEKPTHPDELVKQILELVRFR